MMCNFEKRDFVEPSKAISAEAAALGQLLVRRFSCRAFRPDAVPQDQIEAFLKLAQLSASWCNTQPWQVIVTQGSATDRFRQALFEAANSAGNPGRAMDLPGPACYHGSYLERRRETGSALYQAVGIEHGDRLASAQQTLENFRLFGAPHVLIITSDRDLGTYGAIDCGAYVATLMLAAQSMGIDTIAQAAIAMQADFVRRFFDIPEDRIIICGISFGYANHDHPANQFRTKREGIEEVVQWVIE